MNQLTNESVTKLVLQQPRLHISVKKNINQLMSNTEQYINITHQCLTSHKLVSSFLSVKLSPPQQQHVVPPTLPPLLSPPQPHHQPHPGRPTIDPKEWTGCY